MYVKSIPLNKVGVKQRGLCGKNNEREYRADIPVHRPITGTNGPLISLIFVIQQERESERESDKERDREIENEKQL